MNIATSRLPVIDRMADRIVDFYYTRVVKRKSRLRQFSDMCSQALELVKQVEKDIVSGDVPVEDIEGGWKARTLYLPPDRSVMVGSLTGDEGSMLIEHGHEVNQWIIVHRGKVAVRFQDQTRPEQILTPNSSMLFIPAKAHHEVIGLQDNSAYVFILRPADDIKPQQENHGKRGKSNES